ncbi:MAG: hypothetical protein J6A88_10360 [Oscillospiraceae bacterium]|nr:hypothetical protein [Oscillospiraceae bacterium]
MKYMVGLKNGDQNLLDCICQNKAQIHEVYFSWGDFPNGRANQLQSSQYAPWELQDMQRQALQRLSEEGIKLNLLFNANCYGADSQSRAFFHKIGTTMDYVLNHYGLQSITTTSPLIAKFVHQNFERIEVRASVNMEIGTIQGMDYLSEYFDSYYIKRELNRDLDAIAHLHQWAEENCKQLFLLANSGCLNHCSAHNFHDNLVAHEAEIAKMDNAYAFGGICHEYLKDPKHYRSLIEDTNFIRPEDMHKYEPYCTAAKLATRIHPNPTAVVNSYIRGKYSGNILDILEPKHSIYPYVIENGDPLRLIKLEEN